MIQYLVFDLCLFCCVLCCVFTEFLPSRFCRFCVVVDVMIHLLVLGLRVCWVFSSCQEQRLLTFSFSLLFVVFVSVGAGAAAAGVFDFFGFADQAQRLANRSHVDERIVKRLNCVAKQFFMKAYQSLPDDQVL